MSAVDEILAGARAGLRGRLKPFGFVLKGRKFVLENELGDRARLSFLRFPVDRVSARFIVEMALDPEPTRSWVHLEGVPGYHYKTDSDIWLTPLRWPPGHTDASAIDFYWSFRIGDQESREKCFDLIGDALIGGAWAAWLAKLMVRQNLLEELAGGVWTVPKLRIRGADFLKAVMLLGADPSNPDPEGKLAAYAADRDADPRLAQWMAVRLGDLG